MHSSIVVFLASLAGALANPSPQASDNGGLPLGAVCVPTSFQNPCANGASCYATNSMLQPVCGNFQASCSSDAQCAFNRCNDGFCNGALKSTTTASTPYTNSSTTLPLTTPKPPLITPGPPTNDPNTSVRYVNATSTLSAPIGYTTSIVIVDGQTSSVLVNNAGATTPFGAQPSLVADGGATGLHVGRGIFGVFAAAVGFAFWL